MEDFYFPPTPQQRSPLLPLWLQQQLQAVPQSDPRSAFSGAAQPLQSFGEGAGSILADVGRGLYDTVSLPRRVYEGTVSPTGEEAAAFGVNMVPMAGMSLAVGLGVADTGRALYSSRGDIANALIPSATAQDPYAAQKQQINELRAERQRIEKSNIGPRAKLQSLQAIDAQIQSANESLVQRQTGDANLERDNAAKQAEIRRQEEVAAAAAAREKAKAEAPFRERNPEWSTAFNSMALAVPAAFGMRTGIRNARGAAREARALDDATAAEAKARQAFADGSGDAASYARAGQDLSGQYKAFQEANKFQMSPTGAVAAGGTAASLAAAPEIVDLAMPQGTRAGDNARNQLTSGSFYGQKAALGLVGAGLYEGGAYLGSKLPRQPTPNTARARAIEAEGGPRTADQLIEFERSAVDAGGPVQAAIAQQRRALAQQRQQGALDDAAHQLELSALKETDRSPLIATGQRFLEDRQASNLQAIAPPQRQLPPPVPAENPLPPSPQPQSQSGLIIPDSITSNKARAAKTYGEKDSRRTQSYLIDQAEKGKMPSGAKLASDANITPTRAKYVMQNIREIAQANGLDYTDPKVLRAIATELNANPAYRNSRGTGSTLFSGGVGVGIGYGALSEEE